MGLEDAYFAESMKHTPQDIARVYARRGTSGPNKGRLLEVPTMDTTPKAPPSDKRDAGRDSLQDAIARCAAARLAAQQG